ncbi:hypothetical protein BJV78DRAFT_1152793 [Lactifluus subvellereus]|nr:hypothetical protein BJV78DRAFT_1152793 [Lactifluus subvellereus]
MANNAQSTDSTQPEYRLGPSLSLVHGALNFTPGEFVLVRIPEPIRIGGHIGDEATAATNLPLTSNGSSPQHFAFIRQMSIQPSRSYLLEVYPVVSFTRSSGAIAGYSRMDDATRATLLPLPSLSYRHPTPEAFGAPLSFGNWSTFRDSWLSVNPIRFIMPTSRPFKRMIPPLIMPFSVLERIDLYRETLRPNPQTTNAHHHDDQSHPPPNGGSGDEQGSGNLRQQRVGDGGGQAASGVTSSPTIIDDGGGEKAAGPGLEQFSVETFHDIPVLEGVDEDAEGADATMLDELILLARGDPMWMEELRKYLQEEEKEREEMQKERAVRLARWREGTTVLPT